MSHKNKLKAAITGLVIADAVGVPFEFISRASMKNNPTKSMIGNGTHSQPKGTWSDDSSLTLCLLDALTGGNYSLEKIAAKLVAWKYDQEWVARNEVFDIGITTSASLQSLKKILEGNDQRALIDLKYSGSESDNGNGSLMRILPLAFYLFGKPLEEQWQKTWEVSALTHPPFRAAMACFIYNKIIEKILEGNDLLNAYRQTCDEVLNFWKVKDFSVTEAKIFERVLSGNIQDYKETEIRSGGYVMNAGGFALGVAQY